MESRVWRCGSPRATGRKQGFPTRFWGYFIREYVPEGSLLLHLCSGDCVGEEFGVTIDSDPTAPSMYHLDARDLPRDLFPDGSYDISFADPPYSEGYAGEWPSEYPRPAHLLREMYRTTRVGGTIALLHLLVVPAPRGLGDKMKRIAIHAILSGTNNAIRALNVFRKVG